jgi:exosortase
MSQTQIDEFGLGSAVGIADLNETPASADPLILGMKRSVWIQIAVITVLFSALFWPNLRRLWDKTNPIYGEANWGHAICIPFIGLYYLYVNREKLLNPDPVRPAAASQIGFRVWIMLALSLFLPLVLVFEELRKIFVPVAALAAIVAVALIPLCLWNRSPNSPVRSADRHSAGWFGGFIMFFGIAVFQYAIFPGQNDFLKDLGMVITLFGVVLAMIGWGAMKIAWFPIAFLICGLPWPGLVYSRVAGPLQQLAASVAVWTLQLTGVEAQVGGTKISMIGGNGQWRTLNVAEACAGMRSLMTFISVAAAVAFLSSRPLWQKLIIVLFAVPIAISCNVMRVSGQGLLDRYVSHSLSENFAHQFVGLIMLIPAFLLILLVGWILDQIFVEQIDRRVVAIAPKVITRGAIPAPAAAVPAPRSLAAARTTDVKPESSAEPETLADPESSAGPTSSAELIAGAPSYDAPVADAPVTDAPMADVPVVDAPVAQSPLAQAIAATAPARPPSPVKPAPVPPAPPAPVPPAPPAPVPPAPPAPAAPIAPPAATPRAATPPRPTMPARPPATPPRPAMSPRQPTPPNPANTQTTPTPPRPAMLPRPNMSASSRATPPSASNTLRRPPGQTPPRPASDNSANVPLSKMLRPGGEMKSVVPPPPSVRLAPRGQAPRTKKTAENPTENSQGQSAPAQDDQTPNPNVDQSKQGGDESSQNP